MNRFLFWLHRGIIAAVTAMAGWAAFSGAYFMAFFLLGAAFFLRWLFSLAEVLT